ncbi:hypothetical protein ABMA28_015269 [Loxostege sticticalis]|uniref:Cilia- and flagella-associated protein 52 n=1 Tax=Loxostege sticticalis TaxID=481309 RepID=A0ABD0TEV8_LOXSC
MDVKNLETYAIIGFDGSAIRGLKVHPDGEHIVYPMGNKVCIQEWKTKKMYFLSGHSNSVSTVAISPKGTFVGSGQINHIGFKAAAKLWDFKKKTLLGSHELHKVRVEALAFSSDERYMISLGGRDCGCVVLWDCFAGAATGTAAAAKQTAGDAMTLATLNCRVNAFVTGGDSNLRVWNIRAESKNLDVVDVSIGKLRRTVRCIAISSDDAYGYAGTTGMSGVFATAGAGDVRVWCLETCQELLRIVVPNFTCSAVLFSGDGKSIVTGWNDGNIRAFTPLTGRLIYCIFNTHNKGTSALDMTTDGRTLISGGCEGQVRVWDIKPECQSLKKVLKEHKSPVSAIQVSPNDTEAVSAGTDGSAIIWDLISLSRRQVMYANTLFMCICFEPQGSQLLTGGTDRRVAYWETGSGNLARELEASKAGAINGLHITQNGELFVTGGNDQTVKLWKYQEGIYTHMGLGHAGAVTCCRFSPDARHIVSSCAAGSVIVWRVPEQYLPKSQPPTGRKNVAETPKTLQEELKLPLSEKPTQKAAGDRPVNRVPAAPSKVEKIEAMDTTRSSVHSCCPCDAAKKNTPKANTPKSTQGVKCCRPPAGDNLPTRTTSKDFVSSGGGDKK